MSTIASTSSKVNTLPGLPNTLGLLTTFLFMVEHSKKPLPARLIAYKLGYSLRTIRYHIKALKEKGFVEVTHHCVMRSVDGKMVRCKAANSYHSFFIAPLLGYIERDIIGIYRSSMSLTERRGAKENQWRLMQILTLLAKIAHRTKTTTANLLFASHRLLRRAGHHLYLVEQWLRQAMRFFNRRVGPSPRDPPRMLCWFLRGGID